MTTTIHTFYTDEIAGHKYHLYMAAAGPYLVGEDSEGVLLGYNTSIVQTGKKKWAVAIDGVSPQVDLVGMKKEEVKAFSRGFGIPIVATPTAAASIAAFRGSPALVALAQWTQKHPSLFNKWKKNQDRLPWAELVGEVLSSGKKPATGVPFLTSMSTPKKQRDLNQNLFALMESSLVDQEKNTAAIRNTIVLAREQLGLLTERSLLLSKIFTRYATHEVTCSYPKGPCDCGYEKAAEMVEGILDGWDPKDSSGAEFR